MNSLQMFLFFTNEAMTNTPSPTVIARVLWQMPAPLRNQELLFR